MVLVIEEFFRDGSVNVEAKVLDEISDYIPYLTD